MCLWANSPDTNTALIAAIKRIDDKVGTLDAKLESKLGALGVKVDAIADKLDSLIAKVDAQSILTQLPLYTSLLLTLYATFVNK